VIRTPPASGAAQAGSWWLPIRPPFNGCTIKDATIRVAGYGATFAVTPPKFELIAYAPGSSVTPLAKLATDGHLANGTDWLMPLDTTMTPNVAHTIDSATFLYFVRVTNPFGMGATAMDVRRLLVRFDVTNMEPA